MIQSYILSYLRGLRSTNLNIHDFESLLVYQSIPVHYVVTRMICIVHRQFRVINFNIDINSIHDLELYLTRTTILSRMHLHCNNRNLWIVIFSKKVRNQISLICQPNITQYLH